MVVDQFGSVTGVGRCLVVRSLSPGLTIVLYTSNSASIFKFPRLLRFASVKLLPTDQFVLPLELLVLPVLGFLLLFNSLLKICLYGNFCFILLDFSKP